MEFDFKQNYSKDSPEYEALEYVASKLSEMTDCEFTVGSTDIFKTTLLCDGIQVCANDLVNACNLLDLDNFCDEFIVHHGKEFAKLEQEDLVCNCLCDYLKSNHFPNITLRANGKTVDGNLDAIALNHDYPLLFDKPNIYLGVPKEIMEKAVERCLYENEYRDWYDNKHNDAVNDGLYYLDNPQKLFDALLEKEGKSYGLIAYDLVDPNYLEDYFPNLNEEQLENLADEIKNFKPDNEHNALVYLDISGNTLSDHYQEDLPNFKVFQNDAYVQDFMKDYIECGFDTIEQNLDEFSEFLSDDLYQTCERSNCFGALFGLSNEQEYYERLDELIENEYKDIFVSDFRNDVEYQLKQQLNGLDRAQEEQEKKSLGRGR